MKSKSFVSLSTLLLWSVSGVLFAQEAAPQPAHEGVAGSRPDEILSKPIDEETEPSLFLSKTIPAAVTDKGFTPIAVWTGEFWQSSRAGDANGVLWDSLLTFGFEQDLEKLTGVKNAGTLGLSAFYYVSKDNHELAEGLNGAPSNIFAEDMVRVFEIYYANAFETDIGTFAFRVGQLAADEDFMGLDYSDIFLNSNFGAIPAAAGAGLYGSGHIAFSQYANATLGFVGRYTRDTLDFTIGIYNGDAGEDTPGNHGFDYDLRNIAVWYQLGNRYEIAGRKGYAAFGGNVHSGGFENIATGERVDGFYSFYLLLSQELVLNADGDAVLGAFARLAWAPESSTTESSRYLDAGINWFAPISSRPDDVFAVGVSTTYADAAVRAATGLFSYETCIEATYKAQVTSAISVQPTLQIYFDSKTLAGDRETAFLCGVRVEVML